MKTNARFGRSHFSEISKSGKYVFAHKYYCVLPGTFIGVPSLPQKVTFERGEVLTFESMGGVHLEGLLLRSSIGNWACRHTLPRAGSSMVDLERYGNALFPGNSAAELATVLEIGERTVHG